MLLQVPQAEPSETSLAQDVRIAPARASWSYTIEPFVWFAGLDGQGSADSSPPVDLGLAPADVFGHLDGGFLLAGEVRAPDCRWSVIADALYLRLEDDEGTTQTETEASMIEVGAAVPLADSGRFDLVAGVRYVDLSFDVEIGTTVDEDATEAWVDPWIGARGTIPLSDTWSIALRGDVGGFGVGSQFSWQAIGVVGAELGGGWRLDLGYRAIGIDFDDGDLQFDTRVHGPLLGIAWHR